MAVTRPIQLSADESRRLALAAQGLMGPRVGGGMAGLLDRLGAIQIDTISVLARTHELVPYSRLGPIGRPAVERGLWGTPGAPGPARTFEYWAHAACVMPVELWPFTGYRRRRHQRHPHRQPDRAVRDLILARLRDEGPMTVTQMGGARAGGTWWSWSPVKIAAEDLLYEGEAVCVSRRGFKRVYDLPERAIPAALRQREVPDEECWAEWVRRQVSWLGVATEKDLANHFYLKTSWVRAGLKLARLAPARVEGWAEPAWCDPAGLDALAPAAAGRSRTTLLSPFDSLLWYRPRVDRLFGFTHKLEAYVPAPRRVHGYYSMPLLSGGRLIGRADPAREGRTLVARQVGLDGAGAVGPMARALREAAAWVGCGDVRLERVEPPELGARLRSALAQEA